MSEATLIRYRLQPGTRERVDEWVESVADRRGEAVETLQDESVFTETVFFESRADGEFLTMYVEADDVAAALAAFEDSDHEIDREFRRLLAEIVDEDQPDEHVETLYHLSNPKRP
ncbi:MAG: DUF6176 family protein [Halohasta sp.]